jgi:tetratricopeptide (TPR) repeat protein
MISADPTAIYQRAVLDHQRDFWLHLHGAMFVRDPGVRAGAALAALAIRPQSGVAYDQLASALSEQGHFPEAVVAANRAIEINPNYMRSYWYLGCALRDRKDLPGAVAAFEKAIDRDPDNSRVLWALGDVLWLKGDRAAATDVYRKAADLDGNTAGFRKLSGCLRDLKDQAGAVAALQRAIDLDAKDFRARHSLGQILQQQGRHAEAGQVLAPIKAQPTSVPDYNSLARFLATCPDDKSRDGKRAIEYATTACERTGWKNPLYLDTLAAAYASAGVFEEAVRYQTRALEDPVFAARFGPAARQRLELYRQKKPFRDQGP